MNEAITQVNVQSAAGREATLRVEKKSDWKTVGQITYRAFHGAPPTGANDDGMEALLAHRLRNCAVFAPELDYVAELNGSVIGNIMYTRSKVAGEGGEWETLTFGPVSVLPKYQRDGVGSALIRKTLETARKLGYRAVLIFGHESYYPRFGFKPASEFGITTADGENFPAFMALPLYDGALDGVRGRLILDAVYSALDRAESDALNAKLAEPMDVDEYIDAQPLSVQPILRRIRETIRSAAPEAMEKISWQMPAFWHGQNLIHFAAQKKHIGIYPGAEAMARFAPRLGKYKTSKGAIQFPYGTFGDEQLALIAEIAAPRGMKTIRLDINSVLSQNQSSWNAIADDFFGVTALPIYGCLCPTEDELHLFPDLNDKKVLDIGCGSGHSLKWCGGNGANELWGLDMSDRQLDNAGKYLSDNGYNPKLFCSPMEQNPGLPQGYFDVAYSIYAIGWTVDLQETLKLIASYLKPGGIFIFSWDHPFLHCVDVDGDRLVFSGSYYETEPFMFHKGENRQQARRAKEEGSYTIPDSGVPLTLTNRRLSDYINALAVAGFVVERVVEETDKDTLERDAEFSSVYYAPCKAKRFPLSVIVKARKL